VAALSASLRSKPLLLALVCGGAVVAATTSWVTDDRVGAPEDPSRVLVVSDGELGIDHVALLARAGFRGSAEASLAELEQRAAGLGIEGEGIPAVLALADEEGYGFLALDDPSRYDLSRVQLGPDGPTVGPDARYAVLSVGDLAHPREASVDDFRSDVVRMPGIELLAALFAHARLHPERELLSHRPTVEELNLQLQLEPGLHAVERVATLESNASNLAVDLERALAEGGGRPLGSALESGGAVALPDGGVLSVIQSVSIVSPDAFVLAYELEGVLRFLYTPPGALSAGVDGRTSCVALAGGVVPVTEFPEVVTSPHGEIVLLHTATDGLGVWAAEPATPAGGCRFAHLGTVPSPTAGEKGLGTPSPGGRVARVAVDVDGHARVRVYEPGRIEPAPVTQSADLGPARLRPPTWLGEDAVAATGRVRAPDQAPEAAGTAVLWVIPTDGSRAPLRIGGDAFGPGVEPVEIAAIPGREELVVAGRGEPTHMWRLSFARPLAQLTPVDERGGVDPSDLRIELVHHGGVLRDLAVAPDGRSVAASLRGEGEPADAADVAVLRLDVPAAELARVTQGPVRDEKPRFLADGRGLVFETRVPMSITGHQLSAPRVAFLSDGSREPTAE
jgi:hypothetical protein